MKRLMTLTSEMVIEASHKIPGHEVCGRLHGHSYRIQIRLVGLHEKTEGMLLDFGLIKKMVRKYDHTYLNHFWKFPSAENMATTFALRVLRMKKDIVEVSVNIWETENNCASITLSK